MTAPATLRYPLAGLLAEPYGTERRYEIHGATIIPLPDDLRLVDFDGELRSAHEPRRPGGAATISTAIAGSCARCLRDIEPLMTVRIREEALPSVDFATGAAVDLNTEPDATRLSDHHELDFAALAADAISLEEPTVACEEACPGLCVECGQRLGLEHAEHAVDDVDPRPAALRGFKVDGEESG